MITKENILAKNMPTFRNSVDKSVDKSVDNFKGELKENRIDTADNPVDKSVDKPVDNSPRYVNENPAHIKDIIKKIKSSINKNRD